LKCCLIRWLLSLWPQCLTARAFNAHEHYKTVAITEVSRPALINDKHCESHFMYNFDKLFLAVLLCDSDSADVIFLDWPIFIIISYNCQLCELYTNISKLSLMNFFCLSLYISGFKTITVVQFASSRHVSPWTTLSAFCLLLLYTNEQVIWR